jgi:Tol biopolymer transport system component
LVICACGLSLLMLAVTILSLGLAAAQGAASLTRITTASDSNRDSYVSSLSADGTIVALYSDSDFLGQGIVDDQYEVWLYDTTTMTLTRVTTASGSNRDSSIPSLSTDGIKVAFYSDSDFLGQGIVDDQYEIWLYDTTTMTLTRVTTASDSTRDSISPSLSADGTKVAFYSDSDFLGKGIVDDQYEVWLYDATAMTLARVTTASDSTRESYSPSLSADGTKVAFYSDSDFLGQGIQDEQCEVWLYDTTTMTLTRVTTASGGNRDSYVPSLSADGTKVAFSSDSDFLGQGIVDDQYEVWLCDTTAMTLTRVTTASGSNRDSYVFSLSADGTKVAFYSDSDFLGQGIQDEQYEVWLYDTRMMTLTRVTLALDSNRGSFWPSLSADGTKVAFSSDSDFLGQGIHDEQHEVWLYSEVTTGYRVYLPLLSRQFQ